MRTRLTARKNRLPQFETLEGRTLLSLMSTSTSLSASVATPVYGQAETFTATVVPVIPGSGTPTGTVSFTDGSTVLGNANLTTSGGVATGTFTTTALATGPHAITAHYNGDTNFDVSMSRNISTVAGNGIAGYSGDGGPATSAKLNGPLGIAVDSQGDIFIADTANGVIRKVRPDGTISTLVAIGTNSIAIDSSGNLYLAGGGNYADVIKVATDGSTSTLSFGIPVTSVALDSSGDVIVFDLSGFAQKMLPNGQVVGLSNEPGGYTSNIYSGSGVFDHSGNLFYIDVGLLYEGVVIERQSDGTITNLGGLSGGGYTGDGGPALVAGVSGDMSGGIALDGQGDIFFIDNGNYSIREITPAGIITTAVGNGIRGYSGDGGPATAASIFAEGGAPGLTLDPAGNIYFDDAGNNVIRRAGSLLLNVQPVTTSNLAASLSNSRQGGSGGSVTLQTTSNSHVTTAVTAINGLSNPTPSIPETVTLNLGGGTFTTDTHITAPAGVNVVIANGTLVGGSPALIVDSGIVLLNNVTAQNATNAPTIVVNGGILTVRNSVIQESTGYAQTAIVVTGGTVDLGTAASPGGNTINVNGAGQWAVNSSPTPISAVGDTFTVNGAAAPSSFSGVVFSDFNDDGQVDFGEKGIPGVAVNLDGTDFLGNPVHLSQTTDKAGTYVFLNLSPGSYAVTLPTQPAGYTPGKDTVGTGGGAISAGQFTVALPAGIDALNYNYGELPAASGPVREDQTAGIGFWNNKNGQALIKGLNGGVGTQLGDWLAATFPHMFGTLAGSSNLAGQSNAYVASFFQSRFVLRGVKLDAQVLASALAVYVTDATLDSTAIGTKYGFLVSGNGVGTATVSVGDDGSAFGVSNGTKLTVLDLLWYVDSQTVNGVLYNGDAKKRSDANEVFSELNEVGDD